MTVIVKRPLFILLTLLLSGCSEIRTNNALESFTNWSGNTQPADLVLIEGEYWQSAHWTKEYIVYLKFKPTELWWDGFLKENSMAEDTTGWTKPNDAPGWFRPSESSVLYNRNGLDDGSLYLRDTVTGICYIYEIQL